MNVIMVLQDAANAFSALDIVNERIVEHYRHMIDNISVECVAGGSNFSVVMTRGGSAWSFGCGDDGRIGQMDEVVPAF